MDPEDRKKEELEEQGQGQEQEQGQPQEQQAPGEKELYQNLINIPKERGNKTPRALV